MADDDHRERRPRRPPRRTNRKARDEDMETAPDFPPVTETETDLIGPGDEHE